MAKQSVEEEVAQIRSLLLAGKTLKQVVKDHEFSEKAWEVVLGEKAAERPPRGGGSTQPVANLGFARPSV